MLYKSLWIILIMTVDLSNRRIGQSGFVNLSLTYRY